MKNKMKISKEQIYNMERTARRNADIACGIPHFKHKAHRTKKDFNRRESKRIDMD